jgi:hypothetical protein
MMKLLCIVLLFTACRDKGIEQLMSDGHIVAGVSSELRSVQDKLDKCSKLAADTTAEYLKHLRTDHLEKDNPEVLKECGWPAEWPDGWQKIEFVCPTAKYSRRCRTTEWFHDHPEAIACDGKMK